VVADPERVRARGARSKLRSDIARDGADLVLALSEFLSAHLGCPAAAVIRPDLEARLMAKDVPAELAARTRALLDALLAAGYGGQGPIDGRERVTSLVDEIEAAFDGGRAA
jgi:hypothetical protein